jgi:hypothetical protein
MCEALDSKDLQRLRLLEKDFSRLDALILVARALFGDQDAVDYLRHVMTHRAEAEMEPAVMVIKQMLWRDLVAANDNTMVLLWFKFHEDRVLAALHDAAELTMQFQKVA